MSESSNSRNITTTFQWLVMLCPCPHSIPLRVNVEDNGVSIATRPRINQDSPDLEEPSLPNAGQANACERAAMLHSMSTRLRQTNRTNNEHKVPASLLKTPHSQLPQAPRINEHFPPVMQLSMQEYAYRGAQPWQQDYSGFCLLCQKYITGWPRYHWRQCWSHVRSSTWHLITLQTLEHNPPQFLYINANDRMRLLLHTLNSLLADADEPLVKAGQDFMDQWRWKERNHGNSNYQSIVFNIDTTGNVIRRAVAECILSVFSHHGATLPVILAIENAFWAHRRKIDFSEEENMWLLQWAWYSSQDLSDNMLQHIKQRFLLEFIPRGRPRKGKRVLRKKLAQLWRKCREYAYSVAPWTEEQDCTLLRVASTVGSDEERVYGYIEYCHANQVRLKSADAIVSRLRVLGYDEEETLQEVNDIAWELGHGRRPESLNLFRSGRRRSI